LIVPDEAAEREDRVGAEQSRPGWCNVEGSNLGPLVRGAKWIASGIGLAGVQNVVEAVWILEP